MIEHVDFIGGRLRRDGATRCGCGTGRRIGRGHKFGDPDALRNLVVQSGENLRPGIALHAQVPGGIKHLLERVLLFGQNADLGREDLEALGRFHASSLALSLRDTDLLIIIKAQADEEKHPRGKRAEVIGLLASFVGAGGQGRRIEGDLRRAAAGFAQGEADQFRGVAAVLLEVGGVERPDRG